MSDWKFDPSDLPDISHLHEGDQNRIRAGQFFPQESELLRQGQNPWTKSGKPAPLKDKKPDQGDSPLYAGTRVVGQQRVPTEQEQYDTDLRFFMSEQARAAYDEADFEQKQIIWEANRRAFEAAKKRKEERLLRDQERMEKVLDMLQRIKEDPSKAHLLPPENISMAELLKWHEEMSKPVGTIPFPGSIDAGAGTQSYNRPDYGNASESQLRQDRIWHDLHRTGRADPEDIAEEEAEDERYERKLAEARERKRKEVEAEFPKPDLRQLHNEVDRASRVMGEAAEILLRRKTEKKSDLGKKLSRLAESNFFMGGGVGMVIAAYAFLLGRAPRFGFVLLILAWLVISISTWQHRFFEGKAHETTWNVAVCGLVGLVLLVTWILLV